MRTGWILVTAGMLFAAVGLAGCATPRAPMPPVAKPNPELAQVDALLVAQKYEEAILKCIELSRRDALMPGLAARQSRIMHLLNEQRLKAVAARAAAAPERMALDVEKNRTIPDNYEIRLPAQGVTNSLRTPESPMEQTLHKKVTMNLDNASLQDFVAAMGASHGINMVADNITAANRTFSIHAEDVPLSEVLDYASRNLGVAFHVGDDLIWATPVGAGEASIPMEMRLYRLRKGLSGAQSATNSGSGAAESMPLVDAIKRFVPQDNGADLLFDRDAHLLIVKNTRPNLAKVEDIIEALDITPPQVLIEARFITIAADDLMELGIDWTLDSNWRVTRNGDRTQTRVNKGATLTSKGFADTAMQGLNLTYQGVLTDPLFSAVLHALETSGKSRTLSVPKVTTVNNRTAAIRLGEDFRYFDEYDVQTTPNSLSSGGATTYTTTLVPVGKPVLEELGIELQVTPSVGADLRDISLHVVPELSDFVRYEFYQTGGSGQNQNDPASPTNSNSLVKVPIFRRSRIETEVIVQSGETVVMGGLISSTETKTKEGVPILSSLPLIGVFFRTDKVQEIKQNLLIFVTATLLSNRGENLVSLASPAAAPAAVVPPAEAAPATNLTPAAAGAVAAP